MVVWRDEKEGNEWGVETYEKECRAKAIQNWRDIQYQGVFWYLGRLGILRPFAALGSIFRGLYLRWVMTPFFGV
jgi:hypothetical protein